MTDGEIYYATKLIALDAAARSISLEAAFSLAQDRLHRLGYASVEIQVLHAAMGEWLEQPFSSEEVEAHRQWLAQVERSRESSEYLEAAQRYERNLKGSVS